MGCVWDKEYFTYYDEFGNELYYGWGCVKIHTKCTDNRVDDSCNTAPGCTWEDGRCIVSK